MLGSLLLSLPALADDGWALGYDQSSGVIYSAADHPQIALEEEVLFIDDDLSVEAHFWFKNTSDKPVKVQAAFPIDNHFTGKMNGDTLEASWDALGMVAVALPSSKSAIEGGKDGATLKVGRLPRSARLPIAELVKRNQGQAEALAIPSITQDGKPITITEASVSLSDVRLRIDYQHRLVFAPSAQSHVTVRYAPTVHTSSTNGGTDERYRFEYVLGTGATWKGPIGTLWLALPDWLTPQLPEALRRNGHWGNKALYVARSWEPAAKDQIQLALDLSARDNAENESSKFKQLEHWAAPSGDSMARVLGASSLLKGITDVACTSPSGYWKIDRSKTDFAPQNLVDGAIETAWCEGAKGTGVGEWVELELASKASAIEVVSGFLKSTPTPLAPRPPTFAANGRPTKLALTRADGSAVTELTLKDTLERQAFEVALDPGKYRLTIKEVAAGAKFTDTCIGELGFRPVDPLLRTVIEEARPAKPALDQPPP